MELGVYSFAEAVADPNTGRRISPQERLRDLIEEIELDFAAASSAVVLAAAAARTEKIRLTSAVTVFSSSDPVSVHQDFATLDLVSAERTLPSTADEAALRRKRLPAGSARRRFPRGSGRENPVPARIFGNERFLMQISVGTMPHNEVMRSIELLGTRVAPIVRAGSFVSAA